MGLIIKRKPFPGKDTIILDGKVRLQVLSARRGEVSIHFEPITDEGYLMEIRREEKEGGSCGEKEQPRTE